MEYLEANPEFVAYAALSSMAIAIIIVACKSLIKPSQTESVDTSDALRFPLVASAMLLGLYLLFKYLPKDWVNLLLGAAFCIMGIPSLTIAVEPLFGLVLSKKKLFEIKYFEAEVSLATIGGFCAAVSVCSWYLLTKNWIANNLFAMGLSTVSIELINLGSFKATCVLLGALFVYDIWWVFGTNVMVFVAKNFDSPIKLMFPRNIFASEFQFSMLGLGDIVIPGIFVAQMRRLDDHLRETNPKHGTPYYKACLAGYITGLLTTMLVMHVFKAAQPALLYLVPSCIGFVLVCAIVRGELSLLWKFGDEPKAVEGQAETSAAERKTK